MRPRIQKGLSLVTSLAMVMTMCTGFTSISWASEASGDDGSQVVENAAGGGSSQADDVSQGDDAQVGVKANDFSVQATFEGSGTKADPYKLSTAADLVNLANKVNNGSGNDPKIYSGFYFQLENDINLSVASDNFEPSDFVPIGTSENYFSGDFDGKGHTVTLAINDKSLTGAGLFGAAGGGAVIHDVTIEGSVTAMYNVAGLVGQAKSNLTVKNCTNNAKISSDLSTGSAYYGAGGLIGVSNVGDLTVDSCENTGEVSTYASSTSGVGGIVFGGVIGGVWAYSSISSEVVVTNCINTGAVAGVPVYKGVGGVIGRCDAFATIESCTNKNSVSAAGTCSLSPYGCVGGIVGYLSGKSSSLIANVYRCSNEGQLTGPNGNKASIGGVVGQLGNAYTTVTECFNKGAVSTATSCGGYVGGVVGYGSSSPISNCYNTSKVKIGRAHV